MRLGLFDPVRCGFIRSLCFMFFPIARPIDSSRSHLIVESICEVDVDWNGLD